MIKQIIPQEVCLKCQGCCRFSEKDSVWSPSLLDEEAESLGQKKILLIASAAGNVFFCSFFEPEKNACKIYSRRPFECQLYPFLLKRKDKKTFLAVDPKCPFI
ncbi:MAG: YkgJ family cysteine cluster protein, partial [Candidatus Omnitrophota bacterium]